MLRFCSTSTQIYLASAIASMVALRMALCSATYYGGRDPAIRSATFAVGLRWSRAKEAASSLGIPAWDGQIFYGSLEKPTLSSTCRANSSEVDCRSPARSIEENEEPGSILALVYSKSLSSLGLQFEEARGSSGCCRAQEFGITPAPPPS